MNDSGWESGTPAPGRSLTGGHRGGRRSAASGHRGDYSDARDRTDAPSTPGRRAAYQLNVEAPHRTPSPLPGRRPTGRRAAYPLGDDWDEDNDGDLPYVSPPPAAGWRHQTASIPIAEPDDEDDLPTTPQPPQALQPPQRIDSYAPAIETGPEPEQPERPWPPAWSEPAPAPTHEPPRADYYRPEPVAEPEPEWTPPWEQHTQAWKPDELSDLLHDDVGAAEQTQTGLFSARPYVDQNADILPVTDGYADELLGSDALGPGVLPADPEVRAEFPGDVLDHATDRDLPDPLADPVARWEPEPPARQRGERPLFADEPYTLPQRTAQRAQEVHDQQQTEVRTDRVDLPPVHLTSADRGGRPERKPRATGMSGKLAILISLGASLVTAGVDLMLTNQLGLFFMLSSVLTAFGVAAAVRRPDVFTAGVLPPLAALSTFVVLGVLVPVRLSGLDDRPTAILAALAAESWTLVAATAFALGTIAIRVAISRPPKQDEELEPPGRPSYRNAA